MKSACRASLLLLVAAVAVTAAQQDCKDLKSFECPTECSPTCGSDGRTYSSPCHLWFAQCTNTKLTLAGRGICANEVHWDMKQCAYTVGTDPKPSLAHPREFSDKLKPEPVPIALREAVAKSVDRVAAVTTPETTAPTTTTPPTATPVPTPTPTSSAAREAVATVVAVDVAGS